MEDVRSKKLSFLHWPFVFYGKCELVGRVHCVNWGLDTAHTRFRLLCKQNLNCSRHIWSATYKTLLEFSLSKNIKYIGLELRENDIAENNRNHINQSISNWSSNLMCPHLHSSPTSQKRETRVTATHFAASSTVRMVLHFVEHHLDPYDRKWLFKQRLYIKSKAEGL